MITVHYGTVEISVRPTVNQEIQADDHTVRHVEYLEADVHRAVTMVLAAMRRASDQ